MVFALGSKRTKVWLYDRRMITRIERHFSRHLPLYLWLIFIWVAFGRYFSLSINLSDSLPGTLFLVEKGVSPTAGDYAAFVHSGGGSYEHGTYFLKRVAGMGGSIVLSLPDISGGTAFYVDGEFVGRAKPIARSGEALIPGPNGRIPDGFYYMTSPHPDGFDSRYQAVGWVARARVLGRAVCII